MYDELGKNIKALTSDSSIFPVLLKEGSTDIDVSRYPLVNNSQPLKAPFKDDTKYSGDKKLCNLLAHTFGVDSCNTTSYPDKSSFTTSNGMEWWISQTKREVDTAENKISYQTDIYVDVDSSKESSNCMYGEENCKQPDRFKFLLAADGRLVPADPVGLHYINTRKNLLKKKFNPEGEVLASLDDIDFNNSNSGNSDNSATDNNDPIDNDVDDNTGDNNQNEPEEEVMGEPEDEYAVCGKTYYYGGDKVFINCVSQKRSYDGKTILQSDRPAAGNYYILYALINNKRTIAYKLCLLPSGYNEAECSGKNVYYRYYDDMYEEEYKDLDTFTFSPVGSGSALYGSSFDNRNDSQIITAAAGMYPDGERRTFIRCKNQELINRALNESFFMSYKYANYLWRMGAESGLQNCNWFNGLGAQYNNVNDIVKISGY